MSTAERPREDPIERHPDYQPEPDFVDDDEERGPEDSQPDPTPEDQD